MADKILWYLVIGLILVGPPVNESISIRTMLGMENRKIEMAVYSSVFTVLWPLVFLWWVSVELVSLTKKDKDSK